MRLQFVSDLHLELRPKETYETLLEPAVAPALALLGDIATPDHPNLRAFLEWCSERWETVLYIPGVTELFPAEVRPEEMPAAVARLRAVCAPWPNIHVLHREAFFTDDGLVVLGCTFWGCLAEQPREFRELHRADLDWVKSMIRRYTNPMVVLSHYGPVPWVQDEDVLYEPADVPTVPEIELLLRKPIVAWAFGHHHGLVQSYKLWNTPGGATREITLVCNGLGKASGPRRRFNLDYRRDAVLRVDPRVYYEDRAI
jgi:hypothetical protein